MKTRWSDYVRSHMKGTQRELADRAGTTEATISRWLSDSMPAAQDVIKFARAVGGSPVQALLMAGYLTAEEANAVVPDLRLDMLDDIVLLDELKKRVILCLQS